MAPYLSYFILGSLFLGTAYLAVFFNPLWWFCAAAVAVAFMGWEFAIGIATGGRGTLWALISGNHGL